MKKKLFTLLILMLSTFGLASCKDKGNEPVELNVVDMEIAKQPTKLDYIEGEIFDCDGMIVKVIYEDSTKIVVSDYTVSKTTELSPSDTSIDITWGSYSKSIEINVAAKVVPVTLVDVEIKVTDNYTYKVTQDIKNNIQYREVYSNQTFGQWQNVVAEDIASVEYKTDKLQLNLEFVLENKTINKEVLVNIENVTLTEVDDIFNKAYNDGKTYYLHGVVVALASTMKSASSGEYFIKDMDGDKIIAVQGLCASGDSGLYTYSEIAKFKMGDEVVLPVNYSYVNLTQSSDYQKPYCKYVGSSFVKTAIVSSNNSTALNRDSATVISTQEELQTFLTNPNRLNNYYKFVKLSGDLNWVCYGTSKHFRFFFDDSITNNTAQKVDGSSPVFMDANGFYTTGKKINDLLFNGGVYPATNDDYGNQLHTSKDIYCFLAGGNLYYHEFVIINEDDVTSPTPIKLSSSLVEPKSSVYALGENINLAGGKIVETYNYEQFNKETALTSEMIKTSNVNKDVAGDYQVTFTLDGTDYDWNLSYIADIPTSIEVFQTPTKSAYTHRQGINDINLAGGKLLVTYPTYTEYVDMTNDMLQSEESLDWKIGTVNYTLTYKLRTCELPIVFENKALSLEEFLDESTTSGQVYDLHCVVVGATSSFQTAELIVKSTTTHQLLGIKGLANLIGAYDSPKLDTSKVNVGDEIIINVAKTLKTGKSEGQIVGTGQGTNGADSIKTLMVLSHNNDTSYDLNSAVVIDSQEDLNNFCVANDRYYKLVKLVGVKGVFYSGRVRIEFTEFEDAESQKINETSPIICQAGCQGIDIFKYFPGLNKSTGNDFTSVGVATCDIYCLFITTYVGTSGPVSHTFVVMDEAWFAEGR